MNKKSDNIYNLFNEFKEEQLRFKEEQKLFKEEQNKFREEQIKFNEKQMIINKRSKRTFLFIVFLFIFISGIASVFSYSIFANNVGYTPIDSKWEVANTQEAIDDLFESVGASLVGSVYSYMGVSAPHGYLACDGSVYRIDDYPRLANHINRNFGSYNFFGGDGTTTFAVPDLRGEFLRGTGTNSRANQGSGAAVGVHQNATQTVPLGPSYESGSYYITWSAPNDWQGYKNADSTVGTLKTGKWIHPSGTSTGTRADYITQRPTNTSVLYIIKY